MDGLDPELLRALGVAATSFADTVDDATREVHTLVTTCSLDTGIARLGHEIVDEVRLLSDLAGRKATQMELAAVGLFMGMNLDGILDRLTHSLEDEVGASGLVGDNAVLTLAAGFGLVDTDGDGQITIEELGAAADDGSLPTGVRLSAQYLLDNPTLLAHAVGISDFQRRFDDDGSFRWEPSLTARSLVSLAEQNEILRTLSDSAIFGEIESAKNGERDGQLSTEDLERVLESTSSSAAARRVAEYLLADEAAWAWFRSDVDGGYGIADVPSTWIESTLDYDAVLARTINQHAFASDALGASAFVSSLAGRATWTDVSGKKTGIDIRLASDDGLRALAGAALSQAATLAEQVAVVASLPESRGGVRNELITFYYAELAGRMNERLNVGIDAADPTALGHSGANWMQFAPWASNSVGPAITGDVSAYGFGPSWADRQYGADGNQYIFGDVAIRYAAFLETFPAGKPITGALIEKFFGARHPVSVSSVDGDPLFAAGHRQLRDSFAYYLAAIEEPDPELRQRYTMMGNILIATHEQAGAQHALAGIVDLDVGDDGWFRGTVGEIGGWFMEGSDEQVATNRMQLFVGFERDPVVISDDVPVTAHPEGNRILDDGLGTTLNPDGLQHVQIGTIDLNLAGGPGDMSLSDIAGWGDPPAGSGMDAFPTDPGEWEDRAGFELSDSDRELMVHLGQDPDALPSTFGTEATNWADPYQRQWFISNMFQQMHSDPVLFDGLGDLTLDSTWGNALDYLPGNVRSVAE